MSLSVVEFRWLWAQIPPARRRRLARDVMLSPFCTAKIDVPATPYSVDGDMAGYHPWRFGVVLVAALLLVVVQPVLSGLIDDHSSFDAQFSLLIFAVSMSRFQERQHRFLGK